MDSDQINKVIEFSHKLLKDSSLRQDFSDATYLQGRCLWFLTLSLIVGSAHLKGKERVYFFRFYSDIFYKVNYLDFNKQNPGVYLLRCEQFITLFKGNLGYLSYLAYRIKAFTFTQLFILIFISLYMLSLLLSLFDVT